MKADIAKKRQKAPDNNSELKFDLVVPDYMQSSSTDATNNDSQTKSSSKDQDAGPVNPKFAAASK